MKRFFWGVLIVMLMPSSVLFASDLNWSSQRKIEEMPLPDYEYQLTQEQMPHFIQSIIDSVLLFFGKKPVENVIPAMMLTQKQIDEQLLSHVLYPNEIKEINHQFARNNRLIQLQNIYLKPVSCEGQKMIYQFRHRKNTRQLEYRQNYQGKYIVP